MTDFKHSAKLKYVKRKPPTVREHLGGVPDPCEGGIETVDATAYTLACETRAVEEGHRAYHTPTGALTVVSDSRPGVTWTVTFHAGTDGTVRFACTCPSGRYRGHRHDVPCKHAALAGRRLERERLAVRTPAGWKVHPRLDGNGVAA